VIRNIPWSGRYRILSYITVWPVRRVMTAGLIPGGRCLTRLRKGVQPCHPFAFLHDSKKYASVDMHRPHSSSITTSPLSPRCEDPAWVVASRTIVPPSQVRASEGIRARVEAKVETFVGVSVFDISNYRTWPCRTALDGIYDYASTLPYAMRVWKEGSRPPRTPEAVCSSCT
jgi:hypothetical protein